MVEALEKEIPYCTIFLVLGALTCHTLVLVGNLEASAGINSIGTSTAGWSNVGLGMAESFKGEMDDLMTDVTSQLTQTISQLMTVSKTIDSVISVVGNATEAAGMGTVSLLATVDGGIPTPEAIAAARNAVISQLTQFVEKVFARISDGMEMLLDKVEPALKQVGAWLISFGDKIQAGIEGFSTTIDKVQKIFDQMMAQMAGDTKSNSEYMIWNTFNLFDTDFSGTLSLEDFKKAGEMYGITALAGTKSEELHRKYDTNEDLEIDNEGEFENLVLDETLPNVMAVVLRQYAKVLSQVGATVGAAKMRDEAAHGVTAYLNLVSAKNRTKVSWVVERLVNGSLPMPFTADVLKNLAQSRDDPSVVTTLDVGQIVADDMARINSSSLVDAVDLLSQSSFFESEGFDVKDQPKILEQVSSWSTAALKGSGDAASLLALDAMLGADDAVTHGTSLLQEEDLTTRLASKARKLAERNGLLYMEEKRQIRIARHEQLFQSPTSRVLFDELLGGAMAFREDPAAERAVKGGVPAVPATLEFVKFLSWNASRDSGQFMAESMTYSGQSSSAADAFATQIQGMVKRVTGFLNAMEEYATPAGIHRLRTKIEDFVVKGEQEILHVVLKQVNRTLDKAVVVATKAAVKAEEKKQKLEEAEARADEESAVNASGFDIAEVMALQLSDDSYDDQIPDEVFGAFSKISALLSSFQSILPTCIENLKVARKGVSAASSTLDSTFATLHGKGPKIFSQVAQAYSIVWILYFCLLAPITLSILFYGFWASGWFGGPGAEPAAAEGGGTEESYEPPAGFMDKIKTCCGSCCHCITSWCYPSGENSAEMCFWSMLLLAQVGVLLLFLVAILLCILAGVKAFLASGCASIYIVNDPGVCTNTIKLLQSWLATFKVGESIDIDNACEENTLLMCRELGAKMQSSAVLTSVGGLVGAVFSFQMLVDSAVLHEKARMRKRIQELTK